MPLIASINKVILCGIIGQRGCEVRYGANGTAMSFFQVTVSEEGRDGKTYDTYVDCQAWGKMAESLVDYGAGDVVLIEGTLRKRKRNDTNTYEMSVNVETMKPMYRGDHVTHTSEKPKGGTTPVAEMNEEDIPF